MRKLLLLILLIFPFISINAQQYSLYNTRTLFDSFENPSQKAFIPDSSRRFAISFLPTFGFNAALGGPVVATVRSLMNDDDLNSAELQIGKNKSSRLFANMNTYLLMFRLYSSLKGDEELGLSWQLRSDNQAIITNETIAIFDDYTRFSQSQNSNIFNNEAYSQNFHQLSLSYRTNMTKDMGIGLKMSYLSGIAYNQLKISESRLAIDRDADYFDLYLNGKFKTNFFYDSIGSNFVSPGFKNPGMAVSASMNYQLPGGWYLLANLKDVGFINWNKKSSVYIVDRNIAINNASANDADDRLVDELDYDSSYEQKGFTTMINGKAELLINKKFSHYQPSLLFSKNLFYKGADIALLNNLNFNKLNFGLSATYNTSNILQVGSQFLLKSPNAEFFIGSDQSFKSISELRALIKDEPAKGYPGISFYMGFSMKFGYVIEHHENANRIHDFNTGMGFFERMLRRIGIRL